MNRRSISIRAVAVIASLCAGSALAQKAAIQLVDEAGVPKFTQVAGDVPGPTTRTIPHWSFAQMDPTNGVTYPITMVGSDPALGNTTIVDSQIIPLRMSFAAGVTLDGSNRVDAVKASPVYSSYAYSKSMAGGASGQYGDVFMRAQFNRLDNGYHVQLGGPAVLPTVTIDVPQNQGIVVQNRRGVLIGLVDITWFSSRLQNLMGQLHIDPATLPVFLTDNVMLYISDPSNCCVIGYHGASKASGNGAGSVNSNGAATVQTFIYSAYSTPGTFRDEGIQDIHALGHEVAEWLDDPFTNNVVQPWLTPTAPQYGCTGLLETGDPVVGIWFPLPGNPDSNPLAKGLWHPEDEVYASWFLRQSPSTSFGGNYTFMGPANPFPGFAVPATGCN